MLALDLSHLARSLSTNPSPIEQFVGILNLPKLYRHFVALYEIDTLESIEVFNKAKI
jgi:hypothetical protein